MNKILMNEEENASGSGGEQSDVAQEEQGGGGAGVPAGDSQFVPYARFQEVNGKYRDLESRYTQMEAMLREIQDKGKPDPDQEFETKFYKNPVQTMRDFMKENIAGLKAEGTQKEQTQARQAAIKWFESQEHYTPELAEKAAAFITENGLGGIDPAVATRLAYQFCTMGDGSGYVRQIKEGLHKPGFGGKGKDMPWQDELAKLDPNDEKYDEKMKAIHAKIK